MYFVGFCLSIRNNGARCIGFKKGESSRRLPAGIPWVSSTHLSHKQTLRRVLKPWPSIRHRHRRVRRRRQDQLRQTKKAVLMQAPFLDRKPPGTRTGRKAKATQSTREIYFLSGSTELGRVRRNSIRSLKRDGGCWPKPFRKRERSVPKILATSSF
jgi:hypothetical protein